MTPIYSKMLEQVLARCLNRQPPPVVTESSRPVINMAREHLTQDSEAPLEGPQLFQAILHRAERGKETYGQYLMTHDGRDHVADAVEELLDACVYLEAALAEKTLNEPEVVAVMVLQNYIEDILLRAQGDKEYMGKEALIGAMDERWRYR